jgi:hypothetical protein
MLCVSPTLRALLRDELHLMFLAINLLENYKCFWFYASVEVPHKLARANVYQSLDELFYKSVEVLDGQKLHGNLLASGVATNRCLYRVRYSLNFIKCFFIQH